jgi:uncharacterized membrane protein YqiK
MQSELAQANDSVDIETSRAHAASARAEGEAAVITTTGNAEATRTEALGEATAAAEEALGLARAKGFDAQRRAIGAEQTAMVAALREVGAGHVKIVPDIQVGAEAGVVGGLGALLMGALANGAKPGDETPPERESETVPAELDAIDLAPVPEAAEDVPAGNGDSDG